MLFNCFYFRFVSVALLCVFGCDLCIPIKGGAANSWIVETMICDMGSGYISNYL